MIFTIGTSDRTSSEFFEPLLSRRVKNIVDVRSKPWSRRAHFTRRALEASAEQRGMGYLWLGETLGGLSPIPVDDQRYAESLDHLLALHDPLAIFCAEGDPAHCHRSSVIGAALMVRRGVIATNILRDGREENVARTLLRTKAATIPECLRADAVRASIKAEGTSRLSSPRQSPRRPEEA